MFEVIEIPIELIQFQLPPAVQDRLQFLLARQDAGVPLSPAEQFGDRCNAPQVFYFHASP